jgi:anion transporter
MTRKILIFIGWALALAALALFLIPLATGHSTPANRAAAVVLLTMGLLATGVIPEYLTSLLFFLLAMLLAIAPPAVVFSGFASSTLWLVFGGLIVAEAVGATGLGKRLAARLLDRITLTYARLITLTVVFSTALAFVMPATLGRILLLLPLFGAVAAHAGLKPGGRGYNGVCLAAMMSTYQCGTAVLPANAPNLVLAGAAESLYGVHFSYAEYLAVQFPVMGILKAALIAVLACALFREDVSPVEEHQELGSLSREERRLCVILITSLALWATDFLHGIQPGWIALAAGVLCVFPRIGVIPFGVMNSRINVGAVFYIGAVLGLGAVLSHTGVGRDIASGLSAALALEKGNDFSNFLSLSLLSSVAGLLTTNPVQPALLAPLAAELAATVDWPVKAALMTFAVGFTTVILPYQVPPVVVGLQAAGISARLALRLTLPLAASSLILLVPLDYAWWKVIGYIPAR